MNPECSTPYPIESNSETAESENALFQKIASLLTSKNISYTVLEHEYLGVSAAASSSATKTRPEQGAKALVMLSNGETPLMVVLRGPDMADRGALKRAIGTKDLRMATSDEVKEITGAEVGTIPAIGNIFDMQTYCDEQLIHEGEVAFGTGLPNKTIMVSAEDYLQAASPIVGNYSKMIDHE